MEEFKVGDVVANTKTKWVGIVRIADDGHGETKTDADGNTYTKYLELYNPEKHINYHIAPSTKKEMEQSKGNSNNSVSGKYLGTVGNISIELAPAGFVVLSNKSGDTINIEKDKFKEMIKLLKTKNVISTENITEGILHLINEQSRSSDDLAKKYIFIDERFVAYNESYWQWEYDTDLIHAFLFLNESTGILRLQLVREHIKSGLGAGTQFEVLEQDINVGNIKSPKLALIRGYLKKHGHDRTRAGQPFPKLWQNPNRDYEKQDLKLILMEQ